MKTVLFACTALALGLAATPSAMAANAKTPYRNVDKGNDAGNDTGDARIDALNAAQLDQNYKGPYTPVMPGTAVPPPPAGSMPYTDVAPAAPAKPAVRKHR